MAVDSYRSVERTETRSPSRSSSSHSSSSSSSDGDSAAEFERQFDRFMLGQGDFANNDASSSSDHQSAVLPPNAYIFLNRYHRFVGQIVKTGTIIQILNEGGWRPLSRNQDVIYDRIRNRRPTDPREYRIPRVSYREWDRLMRNGVQVGVVQNGVGGNQRIMDIHDLQREIEPEHDDVLERLSGWDDARDEGTYSHLATYWREMWLVPALLPRNGEEEREAERLDQIWLESQRWNRRRRH